MDKRVAPKIVEIMGHYLIHLQQTLPAFQNLPEHHRNEPLLLVGMELAGGMLVSQFAAFASTLHEEKAKASSPPPKSVYEAFDFLYVRKSRKTTGTCQQLEGEQKFTTRTPESPVLYAIWIDDALSTGTSLLEGIEMLKKEYNIEVKASLYLVDRSKDRKDLALEKQKLAHPVFANVEVAAVYDLEEVDQKIGSLKK